MPKQASLHSARAESRAQLAKGSRLDRNKLELGDEGKEPTMKKITTIIAAATATALALALTGCGQQAEQQASEPSTGFKVEVQAESWDAEQSTPAIVVLTPKADDASADESEEPTPIVNAIPANETATIEVDAGTYALDLVSPINADGSIYKVPEGTEVEVVEGELDGSEAIELELIPAEQATSEQVTAIVSALTVALTDQAGVPDAAAILDKAKANAKCNPNVTEEAIQAAKDKAEEAVESGKEAVESGNASAAGAAQASGNAGQQASGSAGSGSSSSAPSQAAPAPSAPSHTHDFQPHYYTHQVLVGSHYVCYTCNKTVSDPAAHQEEAGRGSSHPCGTEPTYETKTDIDYYYCSCGATQ